MWPILVILKIKLKPRLTFLPKIALKAKDQENLLMNTNSK